MKRNILLLFLAAAPLVGASSLVFQASCSATTGTCSGSYNGNEFVFSGPFADGRVSLNGDPNFPYQPVIDFSIGTSGGVFTYGGNTCDYDVLLGGGVCDGEVAFGAYMGPPSDAGFSPGQVITVTGTGTASGYFCWQSACPANGPPPGPLFTVPVKATYYFTLTNPGTDAPWTWSSAQVSSVPEPGSLVIAMCGLLALAASRRGLRRDTRCQ